MFGTAVTELKDIKEAVATYTSRAAEKLRRQHGAASMISVFLIAQEKSNGPYFKHGLSLSAYTTLPYPTSFTNLLVKPAVKMAESMYQPGKKYKKAGVILSGLVPDDCIQGNLFEEGFSLGQYLMDVIDNINFSMRDDKMKFASAGTKKNWKMRRQYHSRSILCV